MYCALNPKLFKEFTSMKKKIKPAFADDWRVIFNSYNYIDDVVLESKKLGQQIAGIRIFDLFAMLKNYNVDLKSGEYIDGEFIIGSDRKLYNRTDYDEWIKKYGNIVESKVTAKNLILGNEYLFKCGAKWFLIAIDRRENKKAKYIFANESNNIIYIEILNDLKKVSKDLGNKFNFDLEKAYAYYLWITFSDSKIDKLKIDSMLKKAVKFKKVYDVEKGILDEKYFKGKNIKNEYNLFFIKEHDYKPIFNIIYNAICKENISYNEKLKLKGNKIICEYDIYNYKNGKGEKIKKIGNVCKDLYVAVLDYNKIKEVCDKCKIIE